MRLWSIHPKYLDSKGLVAVWREGLLAKKVLEGKTKGYTNHPQLYRFKNINNPIESINQYLTHIYNEASLRMYNFDDSKIQTIDSKIAKISVTSRQLYYEFELLKYKLSKRNLLEYSKIMNIENIELHPLFYSVNGEIENWEKVIPEIYKEVEKSTNN